MIRRKFLAAFGGLSLFVWMIRPGRGKAAPVPPERIEPFYLSTINESLIPDWTDEQERSWSIADFNDPNSPRHHVHRRYSRRRTPWGGGTIPVIGMRERFPLPWSEVMRTEFPLARIVLGWRGVQAFASVDVRRQRIIFAHPVVMHFNELSALETRGATLNQPDDISINVPMAVA